MTTGCKGGCKSCKAQKMHRDKRHPDWEKMFWDSIYMNDWTKYNRSPRWQDRVKYT